VSSPLAVLLILAFSGAAPGRVAEPAALQAESLMPAARRIAGDWLRHDFAALVGVSPAVQVQVPGAQPSAPVRPAQAVSLLEAFVEGATEVEVEVLAAREVEPGRAYVEVQRIYVLHGSAARRVQLLYFGLRREEGTYRLTEVRALP
jgi:hypothetical protein